MPRAQKAEVLSGGNRQQHVVEDDVRIDAAGAARFLDHSCEPNVAFREPREFVALRAIEPGEELTCDYSLTEDEALWRMECRCGADSCRGVARAVQFLPADLAECRWPHITPPFGAIWSAAQGSTPEQ